MKKTIISLLLSIILIFSCVSPTFAKESVKTMVYDFYKSNMLFKQNDEAIIAGTAPKETEITVELKNSKKEIVATGKTISDKNNEFAVYFTAPKGSYEEYTIHLYKNGSEFKKLRNVVFGELFLASGQSNMQYPLAQAKGGKELYERDEDLSKNIRVLITPFYAELDGTKDIPSSPLKDIPNSKWVTGEYSDIYAMSAVAYYFADKLQKELDVPVGILNIPLGGTTIASWLSREAIDSDQKVKNDLIAREKYIEESQWYEDNRNLYHDMTTNYNLRIDALKHFRLTGMIWYQGESDLMLQMSDDAYEDSFDLLQKSYTELFSYKDGLLPIIYTQLAAYNYSDDNLCLLNKNIAYTEMQKAERDSRAVISIYDVPITYFVEAGYIHPESKQEVGERMATSALGLIYGKTKTYTAPTLKKSEIKDGSVYVSVDNIGDGLTKNGDALIGFAVCGEDGIYIKADAEIINKNTVRIWSDKIKKPVSATYAYYLTNQYCNLYSSDENGLLFPVTPFVTDKSVGTHYWRDKFWAECDIETIWHNEDDPYSAYYATWESETAEISFNEHNFMDVKSTSDEFSLKPLLTFEKENDKGKKKTESFRDVDSDYSTYGEITFKIRNNGTNDLAFKGLKLYETNFKWYSPAVAGTKENKTVIPADNEWHTITLNLNRLNFRGNECGIAHSNGKLTEIKDIEFCFSTLENVSSDISIDEISFTPLETTDEKYFDAEKENADNLFEKISCFFVNGIGKIFK